MEVGRVKAIYRYPLKSMCGESLEFVDLGALGIPGDRAWAVRDEVRGGIRGAKKIPALMQCSARYADEPGEDEVVPAEITLPDGSIILSSDAAASSKLSKSMSHEVSLWPLMPKDDLDHYRRGAPDSQDMQTELRAMFGREPEEPLPELSRFPPELFQFESPPGTYFDAYPVMLMTDTSLRALESREPGSRFDVRRFRPNFLIEAAEGSESFPELTWTSARLQLGDAELTSTIECPRCVMTTHGFADLPKDPKIMRTLVRESGGNLGLYATVERRGRVRVGDPVVLKALREG